MTLSNETLVRTVCPLIGQHGSGFYFDPATLQRGAGLGLDPFCFYAIGRGGVLGDVEWQVVHSAFGYFSPAAIERLWKEGRSKISPRDAGRAYTEACRDFGRARLADVSGLEAFCDAAGAVNAAADRQALALYAATATEPLADDYPARAMQLTTVLREFRGSAHLVANIAVGLAPQVAHYMRRPEMWTVFGWDASQAPEIGEREERLLAESDALTDRIVTLAYGVLDDTQRTALVDGISAIAEALSR
jgi:hypothetical protein